MTYLVCRRVIGLFLLLPTRFICKPVEQELTISNKSVFVCKKKVNVHLFIKLYYLMVVFNGIFGV